MSTVLSGDRKIDITPTLVIGLGGTGMRVLSLFKEKIRSVCGPDAPVAFFGIDTDEERLPGASLTPSEFALCECHAAPEIVERIDEYEDIKRWWIPEVRPGRIRRGAKMKRIVGRLACYYNFSRLVEIPLRKHIASLTQTTRPEDCKYRIRRDTIRVYVVGSLSGGTGGGFFYDIAVAVRKTIEDVAGAEMNCCVAGIIVQPRGFINVVPMEWQRQKVRANFYAGLREIEFLHKEYEQISQDGNPYEMYLGKKPMHLKSAPFEWIYLVDTINERGQNITVPQLQDMIASNLCLEVYSSITTQVEESILANVTRTTPYASFSMASLRVPVSEILNYCSFRCAKRLLVSRIVKAHPDGGSEKGRTDDITALDKARAEEASSLDEVGRFLDVLRLFEGSTQLLTKTLLEEAAKGHKTEVLPTIPCENAGQAVFVANDEWTRLKTDKKGLQAARRVLAEAALEKATAVESAVGDQIAKMLGDPNHQYGLDYLILFARQLRERAKEVCLEMEKEAKSLDVESLEGRVEPALGELKETVDSRGNWITSLFDRGHSVQRCYESWAGTANGWAKGFLRNAALVEGARVFQRLQETANRLLSSLKHIGSQVDRMIEVCDQGARSVARGLQETSAQHVLVTNVLSAEDLPRIYEDLMKQIDIADLVPLAKPRPDRSMAWVNIQIEDMDGLLHKQLLPAIAAKFAPKIHEFDVFKAAERFWKGSIKQWVQNVLQMCSPFCNWNRVCAPHNVLSTVYLGLEDAPRQKELLGEIDEGKVQLASTGDPHEIVVHALTAGYPASAVTGLGPQGEDRFYYELYCKKVCDPRIEHREDEHVHVDRRWFNADGTPNLPEIK